ncbi:hypothetical protein CBR_g8469 [Chara braunii]|uniref:Reverse transcriptase domain-containing protein n=1 Tax=Chara braunii TaxID=69332 RepID=A0A388KMA4_CHABU|nr:hypothetical protein CBR_g8469 [Chara braunii]|eukprot:GBG71167.1 hypothetical protein CBR_g8469 [Chara braunii]
MDLAKDEAKYRRLLRRQHFQATEEREEPTEEESDKESTTVLMENLLYTCNWQQHELLAMKQIFIRYETTFRTQDQKIVALQTANRDQQAINDQLQTTVSTGLARLCAIESTGSAVVDCSPTLATQAKQLEERINHAVASLGDISKFVGASTVSNQLQTFSDHVQQQPAAVAKEWKMPNFKIEKFDDYHKTDPLQWWMTFNAEADVHHVPPERWLDALYLQLIGGAQAFMTHMVVTLECTIATLHTKITWEEFEKKWRTWFMVNNDKRHALNKIFRIFQGQQTSREWLTEWQRLVATPELNLPFDSIRAEFFARSCDALTAALGNEFQYETFDAMISKSRELIQGSRRAANEARRRLRGERQSSRRNSTKSAHGITLEDVAVPPRGCIYRMSEEEFQVLEAQLDDLLAKGWIRPSCSPYGAPVLFIRKKNKDLRLCIDYRKLNAQTIKNADPLPRIDDLLERLGGANYLSKLDLKFGYHQIEIQPKDRYKTAFKTWYGHFEWIVMPFGLTNAPTTFQAAMTTEFCDLLDHTVLIYLDDILVYSRSLDEHLEHLRAVLEWLRIAKYKVNRDKCEFAHQELEYLGHYVTPQGIRPFADKPRRSGRHRQRLRHSFHINLLDDTHGGMRHQHETEFRTTSSNGWANGTCAPDCADDAPHIRPDQKDWVDRLPNIEFAYNTSVHPTISVTPFELHHGGRKGHIFADILLPRAADIDAACSPASTRKYRELLAKARTNMQKAQVRMQQQANRRRIPCPICADNLVWVTSEEFELEQHVSRKLLPKWFGPWKVTSEAGDDPAGPSFIIEISPHLTVHLVFHTSKLAVYTPASPADFPGRQSHDPPSMDGHQEVDRVLAHRKHDNKPMQYKVTFKQCNLDDTRRISRADLKATTPLIFEHYQKQRLAKEAAQPARSVRISDRQLCPRS